MNDDLISKWIFKLYTCRCIYIFRDKNLKKNIIENIYIYTFKTYDILHMCCF